MATELDKAEFPGWDPGESDETAAPDPGPAPVHVTAPDPGPAPVPGPALDPGTAPVLPKSRLRRFFVLRPGTFENALTDIRAQMDPQVDGELQSSWLVTEVDHWNQEGERIAAITERSLLICKYDFMMLSLQSCRRIPLNYIDSLIHGTLTLPPHSISRREGLGLRVHWDKLREAPFTTRWNPWSNDIPYTTFIEHPVKGATEMFTSKCQLEMFQAQLAAAVQRAHGVDPVPGRANGALILNRPIVIDTYVGLISLISNQNKLGYSLARGSVGF
ncbi:tumor protein p63-regulated gene 1-like protein isoform X3 [Amblyraja radiata]|uniref:tumor protein p63-regulated gene 1-like protein isoform X3 n=1 Tax=Amblyraja radiata TaxID=386614 RepID=UPI00140346C5|nr:tumor protein p63-regulated gene 1-like protein isoform X3 [Amblyraja radiata]